MNRSHGIRTTVPRNETVLRRVHFMLVTFCFSTTAQSQPVQLPTGTSSKYPRIFVRKLLNGSFWATWLEFECPLSSNQSCPTNCTHAAVSLKEADFAIAPFPEERQRVYHHG